MTDENKLIISKKLKGKKYNRVLWKVFKEDFEAVVTSSNECMKLIGISISKRTTIHQVINGKRNDINGYKIIDLKK
jgi:hypothetical protein